MDVNIRNLQMLFAQHVRYEIPRFQRPYVWGAENQWAPLWEDVQATAERHLHMDHGQRDPLPPTHFLGAVVLQQDPHPTGALETRRVVDGQQRLITLQLLLEATRKALEQRGQQDALSRLKHLVHNPKEFQGNDPDKTFKVWPTEADRNAFRDAMNNQPADDSQDQPPIVQAYEFFHEQAQQWLNDHATQCEALEKAITNLLQLVVIDLDLSDDPHIIFETLNARGTPLLQSDLIKNLISYEANKQNSSELWPFDDKWWRGEVRQGRLLRPRVDVFLNYWLTMRTGKEVSPDDVFSKFRRYHNEHGSIEEVARDIDRVQIHYRILEDDNKDKPSSRIEKFTYRWKTMQAGAQTSVLLWLLSSDVPPRQLNKGFVALESHLVRRMLCGISRMGYNLLMTSLLNRLNEVGPECAGDTIVDFLRTRSATFGRWPEDRELKDAFLERHLFKLLTRARLRLVLEAIEEELRTDKAESQDVARDLTIEHVMPQNWEKDWPLAPDSTEESYEYRRKMVHTIGNLTLVNQPLNSSLSNAAWPAKRNELEKHTTLFLNKDLVDQASGAWNETAITERAKRLWGIAKRVWPHADGIS